MLSGPGMLCFMSACVQAPALCALCAVLWCAVWCCGFIFSCFLLLLFSVCARALSCAPACCWSLSCCVFSGAVLCCSGLLGILLLCCVPFLSCVAVFFCGLGCSFFQDYFCHALVKCQSVTIITLKDEPRAQIRGKPDNLLGRGLGRSCGCRGVK